MPEREPQVPIIVKVTEATKKYAQDEVKDSESFKNTVNNLAIKMGVGQNPQVIEAISAYVEQGVGLANRVIGMLPAFSNLQARPEILAKLKEDKVEGAWVDILAKWNVNDDPYGIGVLRDCKEKDKEEILEKAKEAENEQQKKQIKLQAEAVSKGQDLIISYYSAQIQSSGSQKAA